MNFGDDAGFVVSIITARDGVGAHRRRRVRGRRVPPHRRRRDRHRLGRRRPVPRGDARHRARRATATYEITGSVLNLIPLRNRRTTPEGEQLVTRISEGHDRVAVGRALRVRALGVPRPDRRRHARRRERVALSWCRPTSSPNGRGGTSRRAACRRSTPATSTAGGGSIRRSRSCSTARSRSRSPTAPHRR